MANIKNSNHRALLFLIAFLCIHLSMYGIDFAHALNSDSSGLKISGQWFLAYQYGELKDNTINHFSLKRGYITFNQKLNHRFSVRFTQDITLDEEGEDAGNIELRLKYCYLNMNLESWGFIHKPRFELGLVHRPWLDFEEHINLYRVQGTMFLERYKLINSADFGITFVSLLGGEVSKKYQKEVNSHYPGRYGSIVLGIYNGAGYHAIESNQNKTFESRLTLRPFPDVIPGLQISYTNVTGEANTKNHSKFIINNFFLSSESKVHTLTGQYYWGKGDSKGAYADTVTFKSYANQGVSVFGELKTFQSRLCVFSRYDFFSSDQASIYEKQSLVMGLSSYFFKKCKLVTDIDLCKNNQSKKVESIFEVAVEIKF